MVVVATYFAIIISRSADAAEAKQITKENLSALKISDEKITVGELTEVSGRVENAIDKQKVLLQYRSVDQTSWRTIATERTGKNGIFNFKVKLVESGKVRVALEPRAVSVSNIDQPLPTSEIYSHETAIKVGARFDFRSKDTAVLVGESIKVNGKLKPGVKGREVLLQKRTKGGNWRTVLSKTTGAGGKFNIALDSTRPGAYEARLLFKGDSSNIASIKELGQVGFFRQSHASWYGPGFYGHRTACGQTLTTGLIGVAHKTLPCGTVVTFSYNGRVVNAPVVDRGPFIAGREWDLTGALATKLSFGGTGVVLSSR